MYRFPFILLLFTFLMPSLVQGAAPNVVLILADDLGYGDFQANNPDSRIPTPHMNRLAAEGVRFTDAHTPAAVCTPTRYGLLTGRYCFRTSLKSGVLDGYGLPLIEQDRPTLGSLFKSQGYRTGIVGKWHLGLGFVRPAGERPHSQTLDLTQPLTHSPNNLGFDSSFIIPASLDFPPYVFIQDGRVTDANTVDQAAQEFPAFLRRGPRSNELVMEDCLDRLADEAIGFLEGAQTGDSPFFLYVPLTAPHKPVLPHPRYRGKSSLGPYGDFVIQVDETIGRIVNRIDQQGLRDNTLIIVTSDNGSFMYRRSGPDHVDDDSIQAYRPEHHQANGTLRGTKADIWEAGHRVPFVVRWPERLQGGRVETTTICLVDLMATFSEMLEVDVPSSAVDSFSFLGSLTGEAAIERPPIIHHSGSGMFAIRKGNWKLVLGNGSGGREAPAGKRFARPFTLFQLDSDLGEQHDVADQYPQVVAELEADARRLIGDDAQWP